MKEGSSKEILPQKTLVKALRDFDWSAKVVGDCDTVVGSFRPVVQLHFHFENGTATKIFEFTLSELEHFLEELASVLRQT